MTNEEKILEILTTMQSDIVGIKSDIVGIKSDIVGMQSDIVGIKSDIVGIKSDIVGIKSDIVGIKEVQETHTSALNELLEWADNAAIEIRIPFAEAKKLPQ